MKRRTFIKTSAITIGAAAAGTGAVYALTRDTDPLADFHRATEQVLSGRFGQDRAKDLASDIRLEYRRLDKNAPDIGGQANIFTEWLNYGVCCLAVYHVLHPKLMKADEAGRLIFETYEKMADHPAWLLYLVGLVKYRSSYVDKLRQAAAHSQKRRYPADWVCEFIEGDGREFEYGLDVTECGIRKYYRSQGAPELTPYLCLSDYVISVAFNRGLVRHETLAQGGLRCDFRYKKGRPTYVHPLRDGWPPKFSNA